MGGGKGGSTKPTIPKEIEQQVQELLGLSDELVGTGMPLFQQGGGIAEDVLSTGFSESLRPAILAETESRRRKGSDALGGAKQNLTRAGVSGSQLQKSLVTPEEEIASSVAAVPAEITAPIFEQATGGSFGTVESGLKSIGGAGPIVGAATTPGRQRGGSKGALGGGLSGAASGAQAGTMIFPGWGTAIGAIGGGLMGAAKGAQ